VRVCGAVLGGHTIGFWQNKNGQALITGEAKTGTCPSVAYLRTWAPFQDLSATATCAQVATYVTNIIKAASSGGAAMNAMLKAQMLATALSARLNDPALGGRTVDTSAYSGAFGGQSSMTVLGALNYAASQSNPGGSVWYAQVKATQELAKNLFDAINNEVAFAA
jgi:hypothetical protein